MKIYTGTSGYGYKEWKGLFYPAKIPPKDMLHFYAERLNAVEINNTFYHMPTADVLDSWAEQVPPHFIFAVKAPQVITHFRRLRHVSEEARYLFGTLPVLGSKLGPVFFQFPETFHADRPLLEAFIDLIPNDISAAFEFRHPSWFEDEILDLLRARGCCICTADTDESPADKIISTASWGYLRLRRADYTDANMAAWLGKITAQNWKKAFVFFKHEDEAKGPHSAMHFQELVASGTGGIKG
ncbi:MAG: DUF72 domain-containing protein [Nitrospirae bacterium]|nr:DUF72 domain-containing protein [Nitrospirota bacterium]